MNAVKLSFADLLKIEGNVEHYHIPKYQREYVWGKNHWETLVNDINENDSDYFVGSVIVVSDTSELKPGEEKIYQVIDGQQRLTTLSIFLAAIYFKYNEWAKQVEEGDKELKTEYTIKLDSIKRKLVKKKKEIYPNEIGGFKDGSIYYFLRVQPSTQNHNLTDYQVIFRDCGFISKAETAKFYGLRRFWKAYEFFYKQLPDSKEKLDELLEKINRLIFIHISVNSQADAFTLFETLNNRGVDLSPIDIIKNSLLSEMEKQKQQSIETSYENWQLLLAHIPDFENQQRFLRHYYNAFKVNENIKQEKVTRATRSNVLHVYEKLIKKDAEGTFTEMLAKGEIYSRFLDNTIEENKSVSEKLLELNRVGASASYIFLLYLFTNRDKVEDEKTLAQIIDFLIKYYVRRNVTDTPNTRDLDAMNIEVVEKCHALIKENKKINLKFVIDSHLNNSKAKPADISDFNKWLSDDIYENNVGMARYLLWKLDSVSHSREYAPDLWKRNSDNQKYIWTIEHVLPEGENLPEAWVDMIAAGDRKAALQIKTDWQHKLGNLTLSGYNPNLSNKAFLDKKDKAEKNILEEKIYIGYKNGLALNNLLFTLNEKEITLAKADVWDKEAIEARTQTMVHKLLEIFKFDNENLTQNKKEKENDNRRI